MNEFLGLGSLLSAIDGRASAIAGGNKRQIFHSKHTQYICCNKYPPCRV